MKKKSKPKYKAVWACDFCGKEFETKKESDRHELSCERNKERVFAISNKQIFTFFAILATIYLLIFGLVDSYAKSNGLKEKHLLDPFNWFVVDQPQMIPTSIPTPEITPTATPKPKVQVKNTNTSVDDSQIECIGPDNKYFWTSIDECKKLNEKWGKSLDYMVNCEIHSSCGGGIVRMSKSQCDKPCGGLPVKNNTNNSNNQQNSLVVTNTQNNTPRVAFQATETSIVGTYYCYQDKVNLLVTKQALVKIARESKEFCQNREDLRKKSSDCYIATCGTGSWVGCDTTECYNNAFAECKSTVDDYYKYKSELDNLRWQYCP